jgi:hypothetical protein
VAQQRSMVVSLLFGLRSEQWAQGGEMADRKLLSAASGTMRSLLLMRPWHGTAPQIGAARHIGAKRGGFRTSPAPEKFVEAVALGLQTANPICRD